MSPTPCSTPLSRPSAYRGGEPAWDISRSPAFNESNTDPEFETFTYGDPTAPKVGLRKLQPDDLLVFYAGLEGWGHARPPALYVIGYFVVTWAGVAAQHPEEHIRSSRRPVRAAIARFQALTAPRVSRDRRGSL